MNTFGSLTITLSISIHISKVKTKKLEKVTIVSKTGTLILFDYQTFIWISFVDFSFYYSHLFNIHWFILEFKKIFTYVKYIKKANSFIKPIRQKEIDHSFIILLVLNQKISF